MELTTYLQILARRKWIVILTVLATLVGFVIGQRLIPDVYKANTVLRIIPYSEGKPPYAQLIYADRIMNTYVEIVTSGPFLDALRQELVLEVDRPLEVNAGIIQETELLNITVEDSDPYLARDAANTLAAMVISENPIRDIKITVVDPAVVPGPPSLLRNLLTIVLVLILGLVGGAGVAFLVENRDPRLHTTREIIEVTELPLIGQIPYAKQKRQRSFLFEENPTLDAFRRLRINLVTITEDNDLKILLVTSAQPEEGKSTIAANLAISMAQSDLQVLLLDADLHKPTIHGFFNLNNDTGFSSCLISSISWSSSIQNSFITGLDILSSGPQISEPTEILKRRKISQIFTELKATYDYVLVDAPAYQGVADAAQLVEIVDGIVLIARRGLIRENDLQATCKQLNLVDDKILGLIVNNSEVKIPRDYYKYYAYKRPIQIKSPDLKDAETTFEPSASLTGASPAEQPVVDKL